MDYRSTIDQRYSSDVSNRERDVPSFIEPRPPLILNPFMRPRPQKGTNLLELFEEDSVEEEAPELVQVYLRLKPSDVPSSLYEVRSDQHLITSVDTATAGHGRRTQHNVSKMYTFSHIFGPDANQKEIFEHVVKVNLRKLPDGHNFTLLTYGASGSGKTYTLMGTVKAPGLVPRSLEYVFKIVDAAQTPLYQPGESKANKLSLVEQEYQLQWVRNLRHVSGPLRDKYRRMSTQLRGDMTKSTIDLSLAAGRPKHYVWVSFVEIYNEAIYDLLVTTERTAASKLKIREDPSGNVYVKGAMQAFVRTGQEAYDVMVAGKHNLQVHATGVHAHSSRSHCIFTITMLTETDGGVRSSCVRLCDLAGSERARRTRNTGARMAESRAINSSLHVLERCLHTLRRRRPHDLVPYRESKLTRLLGAGLSGTRGEAVSMVVTLNPSPQYAHETRHVLQLAAVARDIQVNNTIAETISTLESSCSQDTTICSNAEVVRLRADNERLHYELVQAQSLVKKLMSDMAEKQEENALTVKELVDEARDITQQYYLSQIQRLEERHEDEIAELREEYEAKMATKAVVAEEGTPSRALQNKVMQLMKQIALLEEELNAERLARARINEELLHLRACIEERDEKASDDNSNQEDFIQLTDESENESDEADELCDSLEPTFKKEDINRSRLIRQSTLNNTHNTTCDNTNNTTNDNFNNTTNDNLNNTSNDNFNNTNHTLKDETTDMTDLTDDSRRDSTMTEERTDETYDVSNNGSSDDLSMNCPATVKKADVMKESIVKEACDNSKGELKCSARETYFVSDNANKNSDTGISVDTGVSLHNDDDLKDNSIISDIHVAKPVKHIETQIEKIKKFAISTGSSDSLVQFELLESEVQVGEKSDKSAFKYFDDEPGKKSVTISPRKKEKKTYFDDIQPSSSQILKVKDLMKKHDLLRSPSIVQDEIPDDYEPTTINKIMRESFTVNTDEPVLKNKILMKMHNSIDPFEEVESPCVSKDKLLKGEEVRKSIKSFSLGDNEIKIKTEPIDEVNEKESSKELKIEAGLPEDSKSSAEKVSDGPSAPEVERKYKENSDIELKFNLMVEDKQEPTKAGSVLRNTAKESKTEGLPNDVSSLNNLTNINQTIAQDNNTIDAFENIYNELSIPRTTEFDLLLSEINSERENENPTDNAVKKVINTKVTSERSKNIGDNNETTQGNHDKENNNQESPNENKRGYSTESYKVKYNLRHKVQETNDKNDENEILVETSAKCAPRTVKKSLRLRKRNKVDEQSLEEEVKLKDIVNLQKEFSDVTLGVPAPEKKVVIDMPSPERVEIENQAPTMEVQSCPSKSVTRSRRKLFTPRAEPLEESPASGASTERVRVPRPSYHRATRTRRRLN